jgi:4-methyl-5(b-hydroxyethyl)-thiazole monophosphate biosynthesis
VIDRTFGAIVLPGGKGGAERLGQSEDLGEMCRQQAQAGRIVAGICAAPGLALSPFGLLEQKRATCYPGFESYFPASARHTTEPVVVDGNLITSRGPGTALPFALQLVRELVSPQKAEDLAEAMQYRI